MLWQRAEIVTCQGKLLQLTRLMVVIPIVSPQALLPCCWKCGVPKAAAHNQAEIPIVDKGVKEDIPQERYGRQVAHYMFMSVA